MAGAKTDEGSEATKKAVGEQKKKTGSSGESTTVGVVSRPARVVGLASSMKMEDEVGYQGS